MRRFMTSCLTMLLLAGCEYFGAADSDGQRAYRVMGEYIYVAIPAAEYTDDASARPGVADVVRAVDRRTYDSARAAAAAVAAGGGAAGAALEVARANLKGFSLAVLGDVELPDDALEGVERGLVLAQIGARAAPMMRAWRRGQLKPALAAMRAASRDPSAEEWAAIEAMAAGLHKRIQEP